MENDIKTFVYRTERISRLVGMQALQLKERLVKKVVVAAVAMMVLISCITTISVIRSNTRSALADTSIEKDDETSFGSKLAEVESATDKIAEQAEAELSKTEGTYTNQTMNAAAHKEIPFYAGIEEDGDIMLLGIDDDQEAVYIPADLGAETEEDSDYTSKIEEVSKKIEETAEALEEKDSASSKTSDSKDYGSKIDEVADRAEDAIKPSDVPEKLTYTYNPKMILDLDAENLEALQRIVEAEAPDQDIYGRMLVANVVINRVYAGFASTVKGVIFQKIGGAVQFAPVADGNYYKFTPSEKTKEAVRRVLAGEDYSQGATYFFQRSTTSAKKAAWFDNELKYILKYGCHEFYKEKK
ncbi:MAG: cell wall hydrolase [Lachnospiraceae bacterium]|nr:cell wall hydrolase [Lachnospiraceae bacterium]